MVTASGEIKPLTYTNVLGEGIGKITDIAVKEGDHVKKGDVLLRLESVQPAADVNAQRAGIASAEAGVTSAEANDVSAQADIKSRAADLEHAKLDWDRGQVLFKEGLIPKQDYDTRKATYDSAVASLASAQARAEQARAQLGQARSGIDAESSHAEPPERRPAKDNLHRADQWSRDLYRRPRRRKRGSRHPECHRQLPDDHFRYVHRDLGSDGGRNRHRQRETGQDAEVTIDAIPGKIFKGKVTEVGTQAVLRSSGLASTQSTTGNQEAKDFKVVVTLQIRRMASVPGSPPRPRSPRRKRKTC